jgi:hypothetical protein
MWQLQMQVERKSVREDKTFDFNPIPALGSDTNVTTDERLSTEQHFTESHTEIAALYLYQELRGKRNKCSN